MRSSPSILLASVAIARCVLFCALAICFCFPSLAQDRDINRYTLYTGFDYMVSPARNLTERGFDMDFGVTVKPWMALGGDVSAIGDSVISGAGTINGSETVYAPAVSAVGIPPSAIHVPFRSTSYTFAVGPQFYWRRWKRITFLGRPGFGGIHESATLNFPPQLGPLFTELGIPVPNAHQTDTTWFIGLGGGFDLNVSRHLGLRFTADWVNTHLFSDLLTNRQNYVRFTIGPTFRWGHF